MQIITSYIQIDFPITWRYSWIASVHVSFRFKLTTRWAAPPHRYGLSEEIPLPHLLLGACDERVKQKVFLLSNVCQARFFRGSIDWQTTPPRRRNGRT
jgi:hypothetical protein